MIGALLAILGVAVTLWLLMFYISRRTSPVNRQWFQTRWTDIMELEKGSELEWFRAVVEADKLLDEALKTRRYRGSTMGQRMVSANRQFSNPDAVWQAHKLRNHLVHENNIKLNRRQVRGALRGFHGGLKDMDVL